MNDTEPGLEYRQGFLFVAIFFTVAFKILGSPSLQFLLLCHLPLLFSRSNATLGGWKRAALQSSIALARLLRHEAPPLLPAFVG